MSVEKPMTPAPLTRRPNDAHRCATCRHWSGTALIHHGECEWAKNQRHEVKALRRLTYDDNYCASWRAVEAAQIDADEVDRAKWRAQCERIAFDVVCAETVREYGITTTAELRARLNAANHRASLSGRELNKVREFLPPTSCSGDSTVARAYSAGKRIRALYAALRAVEWRGFNYSHRKWICPTCGAFKARGGTHQAGCTLAAALAEAEVKP